MQPPHHQPRQPGRAGLQHDEVADTCLVRPAAIVDDQHITRLSRPECLQEHVHTAVVPDRQRATCDPVPPDMLATAGQNRIREIYLIDRAMTDADREPLRHADPAGRVLGCHR